MRKPSRRQFLSTTLRAGLLGAAAGGMGSLLRSIFAPESGLAQASPEGSWRTVLLFFDGGWDVLFGPDARRGGEGGVYRDAEGNVTLARYDDRVPEVYREREFEVHIGGQPAIWGAPMQRLVYSDAGRLRPVARCSLFRGVNMNTVAHPTGRAYVNTFQQPAGVNPRGDSLGTRSAAASGYDGLLFPHVAIDVPTFNRSYPPALHAVRVSRPTDFLHVVKPLAGSEPLAPALQRALRAAQDAAQPCVGADPTEASSVATAVSSARAKIRHLLDTASYAEALSEETLRGDLGPALSDRFGQGGDPYTVAAVVNRLLAEGLTRTVTARFCQRLDTHTGTWPTLQPELLERAFGALAWLLEKLDALDPGLRRTTVVCFSEFARTPTINGSGGRDHWFANSFLVFGGPLREGVWGATKEGTLGLQEIDLDSGRPSDGGVILRPEHIGATLVAGMGGGASDIAGFRTDPVESWLAREGA